MNKELVKKYKAEFDHYLNDGSIFYKAKDLTGTTNVWPDHNESIEYIVIADQYVEFRKALAEGKIIERVCGDTSDGPIYTETNAIDMLNYKPERMRIKPDEPKFKVGDWAIMTPVGHYDKEICEIFDIVTTRDWCHIKSKDGTVGTCQLSALEPWKPQPGEWCWFWNKGQHPELGRYEINTGMKTHFSIDLQCTQYGISYCEPFIGNLPTCL